MKSVSKFLQKVGYKLGISPYYVVVNGIEKFLTENQMRSMRIEEGDKVTEVRFFECNSDSAQKCTCGNIEVYPRIKGDLCWSTFTVEWLKARSSFFDSMARVICKCCGTISYRACLKTLS